MLGLPLSCLISDLLYALAQRRRFLDHFEYFVDMTKQEQVLRLQGRILSLEDFWSYRLGSSAVHVTIAVNESVTARIEPPKTVSSKANRKTQICLGR